MNFCKVKRFEKVFEKICTITYIIFKKMLEIWTTKNKFVQILRQDAKNFNR